MHYGTIPVVRETGGLRDTVEPYNKYEDSGNGFSFDRYEADLLYDAIERAKALYLGHHESWEKMVIRDMEKDVSWEASAAKYYDIYKELLEGPKQVEVVEEEAVGDFEAGDPVRADAGAPGFAVAVWINRLAHCLVVVLVIQQAGNFRDNEVFISPH